MTTSSPVPHPLAFPLDSYRLSAQDRQVIEQAEFVLANECMKRRGMSWPAPLRPLGRSHSPNERRYGVSDEAMASQYGYQLPPPIGVTRAEQRQWDKDGKERLAGVAPATMNAYTGEGGGGPGCRERARQELAMQWIRLADPVAAASSAAWQHAQADKNVRALDGEWSTCMRASGHHRSDPLVAAGSWSDSGLTKGDSIRPPGAAETAMAITDVKCKKSVDYIARRQTIEASYQRDEISSHAAQIRAYRSAWKLSLEKARAVSRSS
ncbi:hypothetical protein [Streptomyces sp. NPDC058193]|uniref:hypothetical protein n=1 Tax=Streptomyces sp. NPDC058193 TaxID=3346373 RepID=UPI0036EC66E4